MSKTRGAGEIAGLADAGQRAFGENYVQEALPKIETLRGRGLEWHLIGHLQSNKAEAAARAFDWVQTVDRAKLVAALARHRPAELPPLQVLVQVNIDDEAGKHGCTPDEIDALAEAIAAQPRLRLRGGLRLVRLQVADQVPLQPAAAQRLDLGQRLLHVVLAERALAGVGHAGDLAGIAGLGDRQQSRRRAIVAARRAGRGTQQDFEGRGGSLGGHGCGG